MAQNRSGCQTKDPIYILDMTVDTVNMSNRLVGVSILPGSPLLRQEGCLQLLRYLAGMPNRSLVFLADLINRHNVQAMSKLNRPSTASTVSDEKAAAMALEEGDKFHAVFMAALDAMPKGEAEKITVLRWKDVEDDVMRSQQSLLHKHYECSQVFRQRIGTVQSHRLER